MTMTFVLGGLFPVHLEQGGDSLGFDEVVGHHLVGDVPGGRRRRTRRGTVTPELNERYFLLRIRLL